MPDLFDIFANQPATYDLLVSREDYEGNLMSAPRGVTPFEGKTVVEFGAGSGGVTCLLAPKARAIEAFDSSCPMLVEAARRLGEMGPANWRLDVADHRRVPAPTGAADVAIAGWSICCSAVYSGTDRDKEVDAGLSDGVLCSSHRAQFPVDVYKDRLLFSKQGGSDGSHDLLFRE